MNENNDIESRLRGKGVYPHQHARSLLNPLRRLIVSPGRLTKRLGLDEGMTVLELGPGPGYFSVAAARAIPAGRLLLFDIQQEMLDMAAQRLIAGGQDHFETHVGDGKRLPFANDSVDVTFLFTVLGEVEEPQACLSEIFRVLRPGGLLSVSEQKGDPDYLNEDVVAKLTAQSGFEHERTFRGLLHYTFNTRKPASASV